MNAAQFDRTRRLWRLAGWVAALALCAWLLVIALAMVHFAGVLMGPVSMVQDRLMDAANAAAPPVSRETPY